MAPSEESAWLLGAQQGSHEIGDRMSALPVSPSPDSQVRGVVVSFRKLHVSIPVKNAQKGTEGNGKVVGEGEGEKGQKRKVLLDGVSGDIQPGRLVAIMGPSGAGKTTLLHLLAGRLAVIKGASVSGSLYLSRPPSSTVSPGPLVSAESQLEDQTKGEKGSKVGKQDASSASSTSRLWKQAFVPQDDLFFPQLTVRETLTMAARLRLPRRTPLQEKLKLVESLLLRLGLSKCADTIVGDERRRGISGGEKKRLSLATQILSAPPLIFADEPTTGLDAFQAERVMSALKGLAAEGRTVIVTIHQPRSSVWQLFDDVILMSHGQTVFSGDSSSVGPYFESVGLPIPPAFNPGDFCVDAASVSFESDESRRSSEERVQNLLAKWRESEAQKLMERGEKKQSEVKEGAPAVNGSLYGSMSGSALSPPPRDGRKESERTRTDGNRTMSSVHAEASLWEQLEMLSQRAWRQVVRDRVSLRGRLVSAVFLALLLGTAFFQLGRDQASIQSREGLLQFVAMVSAMSSVFKTVVVFIREREIVKRERAEGLYGVSPYLFSKVLAESPIAIIFPVLFASVVYPLSGLDLSVSKFGIFCLVAVAESLVASAYGLLMSSWAPTYEVAVQVANLVIVVFSLFGGLFLNRRNVPWAFRWVEKVSFIRWTFEALCVNEFSGLKFECDLEGEGGSQAGCFVSGEEVLGRLGFSHSVGECLVALGILLAIFWSVSLSILIRKKPVYMQVA